MTSPRRKAFVRRAQPDEADTLNELIIHSKSYWGYEQSFVGAYRSFLSLSSSEAIKHHSVYCVEVESTIAGILHFTVVSKTEIELNHLFVEPVFISKGIGKLLRHHAVDMSRSMGTKALVFDADPHAYPFYKQMGAVFEGYHSSVVIAGLAIPQMRYALRATSLHLVYA